MEETRCYCEGPVYQPFKSCKASAMKLSEPIIHTWEDLVSVYPFNQQIAWSSG